MKTLTAVCLLFCAVLLKQQFANASVESSFCESLTESPFCAAKDYRSLSGVCNNLYNPYLGAAYTPLSRILRPSYSDGISKLPKSVTGEDLPSARLITLKVFSDISVPHPKNTFVFMQIGQFMAHDMGDGSSMKSENGCCNNGQIVESPDDNCIAIPIPPEDKIHEGQECLNQVRDLTDQDANCPNINPGQAQQINTMTSFLDLSLVYSNTEADLRKIRAFKSGQMIVERRKNQDWLPHNPDDADVCDVQSGGTCYLGGDLRLNAVPHLTILHTYFIREHNRIAKALLTYNPKWKDEKLFQEARKINIAQYQNIVYKHWLPNIFGIDQMRKKKLLFDQEKGYVNDYDEEIDPSTINEHTAVAMRFFHTQIEGLLKLVTESRDVIATHRMMDDFNKPEVLEFGDNFNCLARGMAHQPAQATDENYDREILSFFNRRGKPFGDDLKAKDIQRDRDHGIAKYNDARVYCGLKRATKWEDYLDVISKLDLEKLKKVYKDFRDVDLSVGGALEKIPFKDWSQGPTYNCILLKQFRNTRKGDRFFFENESAGLTLAQLTSIRKISLASIMCQNSQSISKVQPDVFRLVSSNNKLTNCRDIPTVDLSLWKER